MKTKLITNLKKNVLLVDGLPEEGKNIKIGMPFPNQLTYEFRGITVRENNVTEGNWKLLGKLKDLTESFLSALEASDVLFENREINPITFDEVHEENGIKNGYNKHRYNQNRLYLIDLPTRSKQIKMWQEAEQNVFSGESLVFIEQ